MDAATDGKETSEQVKRPILRPRTRSKYPLPSERFPFETHLEVLQQFVARTKQGTEAVGAGDIEGGTIPKQSAALNVKFLLSVDLLKQDEKTRTKYVPTPAAVNFVRTKIVNEERARPILRSVVQVSWFGEFAKDWFSVRPVTKENDFVQELALHAQVSDAEKKGLALRTIVTYLTYSGLVSKDEEGNLLWGAAPLSTASVGLAPAVVPPHAPKDQRLPISDAASSDGPADWQTVQTDDFYLKVRSDPEVLADLRAHIDLLEKKVVRLRGRSFPSAQGATQ